MAKAVLSPKRQFFVNEYLLDRNAARAARAAGYSSKAARETGYRLLTNVHIQIAVEAGLSSLATKCEAKAERVIARLAEIAFDEPKAGKERRESDVLRACELLGKHFGLFSDKLEVRASSDNVQLILLPDNGFGADSPSRATRG
jgi:phage terminase small subunit